MIARSKMLLRPGTSLFPRQMFFLLPVFLGVVIGAPSIPNGFKKEEFLNLAHSGVNNRFLYPKGVNRESELPQCARWSVCSQVDTYSRPWIERLCSCPKGRSCSSTTSIDDGHTLLDRSRQYKVCEPVDSLPTCRYFRDVTWSFVQKGNNTSSQVINCKCPQKSTPYLSGRDVEHSYDGGTVVLYHFSCSPHTSLRCRRKEPCRLFSVNKRYPVEEVTTTNLCQCPYKTYCPKRHTDHFVVEGSDSRAGLRNFSGYCTPTTR